MAEHPLIFIMGCQRSGTTLLGLILDSHPLIRVVEENNSNFHLFSGITRLLDLDRVQRTRPAENTGLAYKAPRDTHRLEEIFHMIDTPLVVWITRPIEQVVASMCGLQMGDQSWALGYAPREIRKYLDAFPADLAVAESFRSALAEENSCRKEILLATLCWISKEKCRHLAESRFPEALYCLDYVDLVQEPETTLFRLCGFLGLEWHPALLSHHTLHAGDHVGGTLAHRPIDQKSLGRWRASLSDSDLDLMARTLKSFDGLHSIPDYARPEDISESNIWRKD